MAVVPVTEFCVSAAAITAALKVEVPVLVNEIFPKPCEPPTAPVKVTFDVPTLTLNALAVALALFSVLTN